MQFLVVVACVVGSACPLPQPIKTTIAASSKEHCHKLALNVISYYGVDPAKFSIKCTPK
jgi:hypothetical protein